MQISITKMSATDTEFLLSAKLDHFSKVQTGLHYYMSKH